jgi:hypothetical protein
MAMNSKPEVHMLEQQMTNNDDPIKPVPIAEKQDYSGAHEKTDPREIALVKKLDRWIMVSRLRSGVEKGSTDGRSLCSGRCIGSIIWTAMPSHWPG